MKNSYGIETKVLYRVVLEEHGAVVIKYCVSDNTRDVHSLYGNNIQEIHSLRSVSIAPRAE